MKPDAGDETLDRLFAWARDDENIRAIVLTGSRADPSRVVDDYSDYDLTIFVHDLDPVTSDPTWPEQFGPIMVRWPLTPQPTFDPAWITQLALYESGVRIDFQCTSVETASAEQPANYFCVLVDKDGLCDSLQATPIEGTRIEPPTREDFADRINAFWWDIPYVAKALSRGEIPYARYVLEGDLRFNKLHPLIRWRIGALHGPDTDVGISGRWFERYLEPEMWDAYLRTYSSAVIEDQWRAMFVMTELVGTLGRELSKRYQWEYPEEVDRRVSQYLREIQDLTVEGEQK